MARGPADGRAGAWLGWADCLIYALLCPKHPDPKAAPTDVRIRVLNSTAIALTWTRVHLDTIQGQLKEYRVSQSKSLLTVY